MTNAHSIIQKSNRIALKIGSVLVTNETREKANISWIKALTKTVKQLKNNGKEIIIVSSGGVALGRNALGISPTTPPSKIPLAQKQAASSVGQFYMFKAYHEAFESQDIPSAQVLLTMSETENRRMHLNARETLSTLLGKGIAPIINENDVISTEEIRFGDNDRLAARVAQMMDADLLVLMSTIDGLYTDNPHKNPQATHIAIVEKLEQLHLDMADEAEPGLSTGGMVSKLQAAQAATRAGINMIIMDGRDNDALERLFNDKNHMNTLFLAEKSYKSARKRWIGAHMKTKGSVFVDNGAKNALKSGKSLLPVGVKSIDGTFERGDAVKICCFDSHEVLGIGLTAYSSKSTEIIIGKPSEEISELLHGEYIGRDELIHRNDMDLNI